VFASIRDGSNLYFASTDTNSTAFTMNIRGSIELDPWLYLSTLSPQTTLNSQYCVRYSTQPITTIAGAVPASGTIAPTGMAGLVGRRRR